MSEVLLERAGGVVTITLNRPKRRNAINGSLVEEAIRAFEDVARTPGDRAVVLTGAGGAFCSGMDLSAPVEPDPLSFMTRVGRLCTLVHDLPRPVIAKVAGPAIGFGCNLAFCCDLVLAGESAVFGEVFARLGLGLDGGGSWSLPRLVGIAKAKELAFFGAEVPAREAERIGLANRVVADADLDREAADWARRLADGPTLALSMMKSALNTSFETGFDRAVGGEALNQAVAFRTAEGKEGGRAFAERRPPRFRPAGDQ